MTSLFSYIMSLLMSLMMLSMVVVMIAMSMASVRRISEVLGETPDLQDPAEPVMEVKDGSIDFNHVNFSYKHGSGKNALSGIDLHVKSGETIGVIGGTGSGKSSLVNLICRLYDVDEGSVCVGGVDVRQYDMEALRNQVSVVLQKNTLFSGTILENLRGNPDATDEECIEACRAACADEFIERMPDGYNTRIERGGNNVSGGQKQRVWIAMALAQDTKVLFLDEPTTYLDIRYQLQILKLIRQLNREFGITIVMVLHDINQSLYYSDEIVAMKDGRMIAHGLPEEILTGELVREVYDVNLDIRTVDGKPFVIPV